VGARKISEDDRQTIWFLHPSVPLSFLIFAVKSVAGSSDGETRRIRWQIPVHILFHVISFAPSILADMMILGLTPER
jgi:hypothetical protein